MNWYSSVPAPGGGPWRSGPAVAAGDGRDERPDLGRLQRRLKVALDGRVLRGEPLAVAVRLGPLAGLRPAPALLDDHRAGHSVGRAEFGKPRDVLLDRRPLAAFPPVDEVDDDEFGEHRAAQRDRQLGEERPPVPDAPASERRVELVGPRRKQRAVFVGQREVMAAVGDSRATPWDDSTATEPDLLAAR